MFQNHQLLRLGSFNEDSIASTPGVGPFFQVSFPHLHVQCLRQCGLEPCTFDLTWRRLSTVGWVGWLVGWLVFGWLVGWFLVGPDGAQKQVVLELNWSDFVDVEKLFFCEFYGFLFIIDAWPSSRMLWEGLAYCCLWSFFGVAFSCKTYNPNTDRRRQNWLVMSCRHLEIERPPVVSIRCGILKFATRLVRFW